METGKVVARFRDGSLIKGKINNFSINEPYLYFESIEGEKIKILMEQLKAIFWVKDFEGNKSRRDKFNSNLKIGGRRIRVKFIDGEYIIGHAFGYSSNHPGIFMVPSDSGSNNIGVFVLKAASERIEFLESYN